MYKNGKLTDAARAKLEKRYARERSKDNILSKIDAQALRNKKRRPQKKAIKTQHRNENNEMNPQTSAVSVSKPVPMISSYDHSTGDDISECPSTPPRNDMVRERAAIMKANDGVNWIAISKYQENVAKKEEDLHDRLEYTAKSNFKTSLEEQIHTREQIREQERQDVLKYQEEQKKLYEAWEAEEASKAAIKFKNTQELKKMREEQMKTLEARREKYFKKELRRELKQARKNEKERQQYEQDLIDRKKAHYAEMEKVLEENAKYKKIAMEQQRKHAEEEIELQKQYAEMLKKQEEARAKRIADTYAQAEQKVANLLDCTAEERRRAQEATEKAERELKTRQAFEDEKTRLKAERRRKENLEIQDFLQNQINRKHERLQKEREEDIIIGEKMAVAAKKSLEAEAKKELLREERLAKQAKYIEDQIKENEIRRLEERADMSKREQDMNNDLIKKVQNPTVDVKEMPYDPKRPFAWRYNYRSKPF